MLNPHNSRCRGCWCFICHIKP